MGTNNLRCEASRCPCGDTPIFCFQISLPLIIAVTAITAAFVFTLITLALRQRRKPVVSGREQMIGDIGEASADFSVSDTIHIHGESWSARTERPVHKGQRVKVLDMDGLTLVVEPLEKQS